MGGEGRCAPEGHGAVRSGRQQLEDRDCCDGRSVAAAPFKTLIDAETEEDYDAEQLVTADDETTSIER